MKKKYLSIVSAIERIHRLYLDLISAELERLEINDINNMQALLIYNIGDRTLSVGEICARGYYLGTNISYNLRKLAQIGYVEQTAAVHDKRASLTKLTKKGLQICKNVDNIIGKHSVLAKKECLVDFDNLCDDLNRLEVFFGGLFLKSSREVLLDS